jgi:hypothetical protein
VRKSPALDRRRAPIFETVFVVEKRMPGVWPKLASCRYAGGDGAAGIDGVALAVDVVVGLAVEGGHVRVVVAGSHRCGRRRGVGGAPGRRRRPGG